MRWGGVGLPSVGRLGILARWGLLAWEGCCRKATRLAVKIVTLASSLALVSRVQ